MNYEIDITRRCNFSCPGCNHLCNVIDDPTSDMTDEDIASIVDQINELDRLPQRLIVVGGEPTLHPRCVEFCRYIKEHVRSYTQLRMNTNFSDKSVVAEVEALGYDMADYLGPKDADAQRKAKVEVHYNSLISPKDENIPINDPHGCFVLRGIGGSGPCGICVHKYRGALKWCYCPNATSIVKLLRREDEFMFPTLRDLFLSSIDKLCEEVCVHCMAIAKKPLLAKDTAGRVSACFKEGLAAVREYSASVSRGSAKSAGLSVSDAMHAKFDRIMCLSCPQGVGTRLPAIVREFDRLGVGDMVLPYLNEHNAFAHIELDRRRFANDGAKKTNVKNCLFGHYGMVKFALDAGFRHVLFVEDDCRFTVPAAELARYIGSMPDGANAAVDYVGVKAPVLSGLFCGSDDRLWAVLPKGIFFDNLTCYMLNRDGMRCVVEHFERCGTSGYKWPVDAADRVWPHLTSSVEVYIPRVRFAVQNGGASLINGVET